MITNSSINSLFKAVGESVTRLGVKGTIRVLESYEDGNQDDFNEEFNLVISCVMREFEIDYDDLIFGNSKKDGKRTSALECSAYILSEHFKIERRIISRYLNKHISIISRYISAAKKYDPQHPFEKEKYETLERIYASVRQTPLN